MASVSSLVAPDASQILPSVLIDQTNAYRIENGLAALVPNLLLTQAAQAQANDMASKDYFSHVDENGQLPWTWVQEAGYQYQYAGENLAVDFLDPSSITDAWINSPTHRANLVNPHFSQIGIATADGIYEGHESTYVVQFFASPLPPIKPQPVAELAIVSAPASLAPASSSPAAQAAVSPIAAAVISPNTTVRSIMLLLAVFELALLAISMSLIFVRHRSPNIGKRFKDMFLHFRKELVVSLVFVVIAAGCVYMNQRFISGSGVLPTSATGTAVAAIEPF